MQLKERVLIIGAHPDDGVLGCGGTIARYVKEGKEVFLCVVTKVYTPDWSQEYLDNQKAETQASCDILGIKEIIYLGLPSVKLDTLPQKEINDIFLKVVKEINPQTVFTHHRGDLNSDHRICFNSALVATRPSSFSVKTLIEYTTEEWGQIHSSFVPTLYFNITDSIKTKLESFAAFESEIREWPHPRSVKVLEALAIKRGSEAGYKYAEAFSLTRGLI